MHINGYLEELFAQLYQRLIEQNDRISTPFTEVIFFQEGPGIRNWQYVYDGQGVNFINIRCIQQEHYLDLSNASQISKEEAYGKYGHFLVEPGDILISSSGTLGRYAIARPENLPLCMNTSVIRFKPLKDSETYAFVYGYLTSREFYSHLTSMSTGSAQVNFGPTHLKKIEIPMPSSEAIHAFNRQALPLINSMIALHSENGRLVVLRDTLLPKLMSGEIDVSKADLTQINSHLAQIRKLNADCRICDVFPEPTIRRLYLISNLWRNESCFLLIIAYLFDRLSSIFDKMTYFLSNILDKMQSEYRAHEKAPSGYFRSGLR